MIEKTIGYKFCDKSLLEQALSHPSSKKNNKSRDNERMEFLGDSILGFIIAEELYQKFPIEHEGDLAKRKSAIVCRETLAGAAREINLDKCLILGHGEDQSGGRDNDANLENAFEALIAAIYLDSGLENTYKFVDEFLSDKINLMKDPPKDPKSKLQEYLQGIGKDIPEYKVKSITGPPHNPVIEVELEVDGKVVSKASTSKKKAERLVAKRMLEVLNV